MTNDLITNISNEVNTVRYGKNDVDIEIWIENKWILSHLSQLRPNQFFQIVNQKLDNARCFICRGSVNIDFVLSKTDPTISFKGLEIVTAPQQYEENITLDLNPHNKPFIDNK